MTTQWSHVLHPNGYQNRFVIIDKRKLFHNIEHFSNSIDTILSIRTEKVFTHWRNARNKYNTQNSAHYSKIHEICVIMVWTIVALIEYLTNKPYIYNTYAHWYVYLWRFHSTWELADVKHVWPFVHVFVEHFGFPSDLTA